MPTPLRLPYRGPEWVERIRSGEAAFEALFRAFAPGLCALATRYVGERAIAEEFAVTSMAEEPIEGSSGNLRATYRLFVIEPGEP
jgi:hypothetical protein